MEEYTRMLLLIKFLRAVLYMPYRMGMIRGPDTFSLLPPKGSLGIPSNSTTYHHTKRPPETHLPSKHASPRSSGEGCCILSGCEASRGEERKTTCTSQIGRMSKQQQAVKRSWHYSDLLQCSHYR